MMLFSLALSAQAAPPEVPEVDEATGRTIKYLEREEIIFDGVGLKGDLVGPSAKWVQEHPKPKFNPLIRLREDWSAEMLVSVDVVK